MVHFFFTGECEALAFSHWRARESEGEREGAREGERERERESGAE